MFELARMRDTVHIAPAEFGKPLVSAVNDALNEKYPNKVVLGLGLCVTVLDILKIGESQLYPGSGAQHTSVDFRLVVFRPYAGEVLTGTVVSSDPDGVRISLGFFDNIHVPSRLLQAPSEWSEEEGVWVWSVPTEEDEHQLFLDNNNPIRFRVNEVHFREPANFASVRSRRRQQQQQQQASCATGGSASEARTGGMIGASTPARSAAGDCGSGGGSQVATPGWPGSLPASARSTPVPLPPLPPPPPAMQITAAIDRPGLGLISWWPPDEVEPPDDAEVEGILRDADDHVKHE